jgi:hypothetical protein
VILVQGDEAMVKLSPAQYRQRRAAARSRDHEGGPYAAGHAPMSTRHKLILGAVTAGALVGGAAGYHHGGQIQATPLGLPNKGRSPDADAVGDRVAGIRQRAKAKAKAAKKQRQVSPAVR